jgi:hypothetical protein
MMGFDFPHNQPPPCLAPQMLLPRALRGTRTIVARGGLRCLATQGPNASGGASNTGPKVLLDFRPAYP